MSFKEKPNYECVLNVNVLWKPIVGNINVIWECVLKGITLRGIRLKCECVLIEWQSNINGPCKCILKGKTWRWICIWMCPYREETNIIIIGTCECVFKGKTWRFLVCECAFKANNWWYKWHWECVLKEIHLKCECVFRLWQDLNVLWKPIIGNINGPC